MKYHIYLGIKKYVVCIDTRNGSEVWRCDVRYSSLINVVVKGHQVIAYSRGVIYGIDRVSGKLLWQNGLRGLGYGCCIIATEENSRNQQIQQAVINAVTSDGDAGLDGD